MQRAVRVSMVKSYFQYGLGKSNLMSLEQKHDSTMLITPCNVSAHFALHDTNPQIPQDACTCDQQHPFLVQFETTFSFISLSVKSGCISSCSLFKTSTASAGSFSAFEVIHFWCGGHKFLSKQEHIIHHVYPGSKIFYTWRKEGTFS